MEGVILDIVPDAGEPKIFLCYYTIKLAKLLWIPFRSLPRFFSSMPTYETQVPSLLSKYRDTSFSLQDGLSEWKGSGALYLMHKNNTLIGLMQMRQYRTFWELSSFVVDSSQQGKGYGSTMIKGFLEKADMPVCLRVKQENYAQDLYRAHGFYTESVNEGRYFMKYIK